MSYEFQTLQYIYNFLWLAVRKSFICEIIYLELIFRFYRLDQDVLTDDNNYILYFLRTATVCNFTVEVSTLKGIGTGHKVYTEQMLVHRLSQNKIFPLISFIQRTQINIIVKCTSCFLRPAEASLLLISKPKNAIGGTTKTVS